MQSIDVMVQRSELLPRKRDQLLREINRGTMERQAKRLENHFEEAAFGLYGARQREPEYTKKKLEKYGHKKPNVKTGRLKAAVLSRIKITATKNKATLRTRGSSARPLPEWQKREIAVMSRSEIAFERKRQASEFKRGSLSPKYARKRKKRVT